MTEAQEIFDRSVLGCIQQGRAGSDPYGTCAFRAPDGSKCAIGWLIPDDKYTPEMEWWTLEKLAGAIGIAPTVENCDLLMALQRAHDDAADLTCGDGAEFVRLFRKYVSNLASTFGLDPAAAS